MKPADDPTVDYKSVVTRGYDRCAAAYAQARRTESEPALSLLMDRLEPRAVVLDVGCGAGVPVTRILAGLYQVTGVDISEKMLNMAQVNIPEAVLIHGDILTLDFPHSHFDAVVAFYSVFHLPREEHVELFKRIHRWLKPRGYLLATLSATAESAYTEDDFFGVTMYWSNFGLPEYRIILNELGFDMLEVSVLGHGYDSSHSSPEESHPLVFAQKG